MSRPTPEAVARRGRRVVRAVSAVGILVTGFLVYAAVVILSAPPEPSRSDASLPNPMGGPARTAPGTASEQVTLGGLEVVGSDVQMGDVALAVTHVPGWEVTNPTDRDITLTVEQPQVVEGCCPGPIYADGELTQAGQRFTVPAGGDLLLQFPLQMHPGMDGPHHLAVPIAASGERAALHVSGNFTADAAA